MSETTAPFIANAGLFGNFTVDPTQQSQGFETATFLALISSSPMTQFPQVTAAIAVETSRAEGVEASLQSQINTFNSTILSTVQEVSGVGSANGVASLDANATLSANYVLASGFLTTGSNVVKRLMSLFMATQLNPINFGYVGDGVTDDLVPINNTLSAARLASLGGALITFPDNSLLHWSSPPSWSTPGSVGACVIDFRGATLGGAGFTSTGSDLAINAVKGGLFWQRATSKPGDGPILTVTDTHTQASGGSTTSTFNITANINDAGSGGARMLNCFTNINTGASGGGSIVCGSFNPIKATGVTGSSIWGLLIPVGDLNTGGSSVSGAMNGIEIDFNCGGLDQAGSATGYTPGNAGLRNMIVLGFGGSTVNPATVSEVASGLRFQSGGVAVDGTAEPFGTANPTAYFRKGIYFIGNYSEAILDGTCAIPIPGATAPCAIALAHDQSIGLDGGINVPSGARVAPTRLLQFNSAGNQVQFSTGGTVTFAINDTTGLSGSVTPTGGGSQVSLSQTAALANAALPATNAALLALINALIPTLPTAPSATPGLWLNGSMLYFS